MTTFIIKRKVVWLQSLPMSEPSGTIILLCEDGSHVVVPAVLLLAASPFLRTIMSDQLPPLYSPIVMSLPGVTEDVLQAVSDILATGRATGDMAVKINEVKEVFKMLGVSESLVCCSLESIDVSNVFDKIQEVTLEQSEINANYLDIKLEVEEMDTIEDNEAEAGRTKYVVSDVGGGKTARWEKSLQAVKQETEDIIKIQRAAFKATRKALPLINPGTKLLAAKSSLGDNSTHRYILPKDRKTYASKKVGGALPSQIVGGAQTHPILVGGTLSSQVVVGGALPSQIVGGDPRSQRVGGGPCSTTDPAVGSAGGTQVYILHEQALSLQ